MTEKFSKNFRSAMAPLIVVYALIGVVLYSFFVLARMEDVSVWIDLIKAAPFAFSAIIVGAFSVLFWALNYLSRNHKSQLRRSEARDLFEIREQAIEKALGDKRDSLNDRERVLLKAHLLFSNEEISADPETPSSEFSLNYPELVSQILKRS